MKRLVIGLIALNVFAWGAVAVAQARVDTFESSAAHAVQVSVVPLADGGCILSQACVQLDSVDGQATVGGCASFDEQSGKLATANVNRCNALIDVGLRRWLKAQRFAVDAGG